MDVREAVNEHCREFAPPQAVPMASIRPLSLQLWASVQCDPDARCLPEAEVRPVTVYGWTRTIRVGSQAIDLRQVLYRRTIRLPTGKGN